MTPKIVLALAVGAVVSVGAAYGAWQSTHAVQQTAGEGDRLLPQLIDRANDVARIEVKQGKNTLMIRREGDAWTLGDSGYPVDAEKVKRALVGLVRLSKLEPKTASAAKYDVIEVGDPAADDAKSRLVKLEDDKGGVLGEVILGKQAGQVGGGDGAIYVRLPGEKVSWLARGSADLSPEVAKWADTTVVSLGANAITGARIRHPDGEVLEVKRNGVTEQGTPKFEVVGLSPDKKLKSDIGVRYTATDLGSIEFQGVRKATDGGTLASEAEVTADKGLRLGLSLVEEDGKHWVTVKVLDKGQDTAEADKIAKAVDGWQFEVSNLKAKQLQKRLADLVETGQQ